MARTEKTEILSIGGTNAIPTLLDEHCEDCRGRGQQTIFHADEPNEYEDCEACNGVGTVPSGTGGAILAFIDRHLLRNTEAE